MQFTAQMVVTHIDGIAILRAKVASHARSAGMLRASHCHTEGGGGVAGQGSFKSSPHVVCSVDKEGLSSFVASTRNHKIVVDAVAKLAAPVLWSSPIRIWIGDGIVMGVFFRYVPLGTVVVQSCSGKSGSVAPTSSLGQVYKNGGGFVALATPFADIGRRMVEGRSWRMESIKKQG